MAISTALCSSFKQELLQGVHNFSSHTFKLALIKASESGTYGAASTNYSNITGNSDEQGNTGTYSAGGATLTGTTINLTNTTAHIDFNNPQFTSATIDANGCMIYNSSASNKAVCVISFGSTQSSDNGTFTITMPADGESTSIIRVA